MADNRMVLVCNECSPNDWEYHDGNSFVVAKYYSTTNWYTARGNNWAEEFYNWAKKHRHNKIVLGNDFRLEYESEESLGTEDLSQGN